MKFYVDCIQETSDLILKMKNYLAPLTESPQICEKEAQYLFSKSCGWNNWEEMLHAHPFVKNLDRNHVLLTSKLRYADWEFTKKERREILGAILSENLPEVNAEMISFAANMVWPATKPMDILDVESAEHLPSIYIKDGLYVDTNVFEFYERFVEKHVFPTIAKNGGVVFSYDHTCLRDIEKLKSMGAAIKTVVGLDDSEQGIERLVDNLDKNDNGTHIIVCKMEGLEDNNEEAHVTETLEVLKTRVIAHCKDLLYRYENKPGEIKTILFPFEQRFAGVNFEDIIFLSGITNWGIVAGGSELTISEFNDSEICRFVGNMHSFVFFEEEDKGWMKMFSKREFVPTLYSKQHPKHNGIVFDKQSILRKKQVKSVLEKISLG